MDPWGTPRLTELNCRDECTVVLVGVLVGFGLGCINCEHFEKGTLKYCKAQNKFL